jgi:predicted secreted Zn-dependent protease
MAADRAVRWCACALAIAAMVHPGVPRGDPASAVGRSLEPEPFVTTTQHYEVNGASLDQLRVTVFSRGPYDKRRGRRFAGWTDWAIQWWFEYRVGEDGCRIERVAAQTRVTYTLPRWSDERDAPVELREAWQRFLDALIVHEHGHGEIAGRLGRRVETALMELPAEPTCAALEQTANALGSRIVETDQEQEAYDRRTGHGGAQGAVFPSVLAGK